MKSQYETNFTIFKLMRIARHFKVAALVIVGSSIAILAIYSVWLVTMGVLSEIFKRELAEDDIGLGNIIAETSYRADLDLVFMAVGFYLIIIIIIVSLVRWIPRYQRDIRRGRE